MKAAWTSSQFFKIIIYSVSYFGRSSTILHEINEKETRSALEQEFDRNSDVKTSVCKINLVLFDFYSELTFIKAFKNLI